MIKALLRLSAILACLFFLPCSCNREEEPSYVGTWHYDSSTPELGEEYRDSWFTVDRRWNYTIYDAPSGQTFSGRGTDIIHDGMTITITLSSDTGTRSYVSTLTYLKDGLMKVETSSVNGTPTEIRFNRE